MLWHLTIKHVSQKTGWKPVVRLKLSIHRFTPIDTDLFLLLIPNRAPGIGWLQY
jgi:hypothetical protein